MLTIPWVISKIENCRNANFASLWSLQVVIIMTTWVMTMLASWRLSVFSAMPYQILDQYSLIPLYYLWWSDILHHSEPLSKCDMNHYYLDTHPAVYMVYSSLWKKGTYRVSARDYQMGWCQVSYTLISCDSPRPAYLGKHWFMSCHLLLTKSSYKPMLTFLSSTPWKIGANVAEYSRFRLSKCTWECRLHNTSLCYRGQWVIACALHGSCYEVSVLCKMKSMGSVPWLL